MALNDAETSLVSRIAARLKSPEESTYRSGGRTLAIQAVEQRAEVVRVLLDELHVLNERTRNEYQRGYEDALHDLLVAAESSFAPRQEEERARDALASNPSLQQMLDHLVASGGTPGDVAKLVGKSASSGTRYFRELRNLGLIDEIPAPPSDGRERPHRVTALGQRLARPTFPITKHRISASMIAKYIDAFSGTHGRDPLTGLHSLASFNEILAAEFRVYLRAREPISVVRVDINGFSDISQDVVVADNVVRHVAQRLEEELPTARIARYESDKFLLFMPCATAEVGQRADAIRTKLDPVMACIGIACSEETTPGWEALVAESEDALARAKARGPGQFVSLMGGVVTAAG